MDLLTVLINNSINKNVLKTRKNIFEKMMLEASYQLVGDSILVMVGAKPNETELQTAEKLAKTDQFFIVFPSDGQIKEIKAFTKELGERKNDLYLVDKKTFKAIAVDIKTCGDPSPETIIAHLAEGVNQAPNLILDITGKIEKAKLITGLRRGWSKRLRYVYLNYHGRWYLLDRDKVYGKNWIPKMVK